ncbi:conserved protein of unknown function [Bradyrhizobium sp. ORS 285]|uniref:hypothetical protein n=1 Tax=Bradyrhizobium sp. ORS 285 TaxID=115808 RepID=UPI0002408A6B|nr:hypothetical protein [Bradyrhizobium sp. ORS 285]CCD89184.1 conserved hypothetical protein [Bradyrhizobium sp. ORS 285]SMX59439.1 conserved protein of unknown function [Bradyrhizobium sp. ORS 285]
MDWFERLTGFKEIDYASTRAKLKVENGRLTSLVNRRSYGIGRLELPKLSELRRQAQQSPRRPGKRRVNLVSGDVRTLHLVPEFAGALFQVASQFNLLEMIGPHATPEDGVTIYQSDPTQGPACAIAAGAATIYRNYFAPLPGQSGQTRHRQLDALADVEAALRRRLPRGGELWAMTNGYALCTRSGLDSITAILDASDEGEIDALRGQLRIGLHSDVELTDADEPRPTVSQAFCSALPVAYCSPAPRYWEPFARLVLEASYEATIWAAVLNAISGSNIVLLTSVGGGAFGNEDSWIEDALRRALLLASGFDLDVRLVSYDRPTEAFLRLQREFG